MSPGDRDASTVTIALPEALLQPLIGLIDAGLRATGLRSAREAAEIARLIEQSVLQSRRDAEPGATSPPAPSP